MGPPSFRFLNMPLAVICTKQLQNFPREKLQEPPPPLVRDPSCLIDCHVCTLTGNRWIRPWSAPMRGVVL